MLLENGFLAIFASPLFSLSNFPKKSPPPLTTLWMLRWLNVRTMLGAALIKIRGDSCWRDLSCMYYHYETTCVPNIFSWFFHQTPQEFHQFEVFFNYITQFFSPFLTIACLFYSGRIFRIISGIFPMAEMLIIQISGNYNFLNMITAIPCFSYLDDKFLQNFVPKSWSKLAVLRENDWKFDKVKFGFFSRFLRYSRNLIHIALLSLILYLSIDPFKNLLDENQKMNTTYDPFHIVGSYGAFGSVGKDRFEVVIEATHDENVGKYTKWVEVEFNCKPGKNLERKPCQISPYHYRIDWQIWFLGFPPHDFHYNHWVVHFVAKLLSGNQKTWELLDPNNKNIFVDENNNIKPPKFIRINMYRFEFTKSRKSKNWWKRKFISEYLPPVDLKGKWLKEYLSNYGWKIPKINKGKYIMKK